MRAVIGWLVLAAVLLSAGWFESVLVPSGDVRHGDAVTVSIGLQPVLHRAERASLAKLACEIRKWPHARSFTIKRANSWLAPFDVTWYQDRMTYDRRWGYLSDYNVPTGGWYGDCGELAGVTDSAILAVAARHRGLSGLLEYGARRDTP